MQSNLKSFFSGKKVLITGVAGFVGTNLSKRLVDLEATVIGVIHNRAPQLIMDEIEYKVADLTKYENCVDVCRDADYVFMCAANSSGAAVMESAPLTHLTPNVVMNAYMLAASYEQKVKKFAFISSNTVYPLTDFPVTENDVTHQFYEKYQIVGWMKLFSEEMCRMYSRNVKNPMSTLVVRPGNLYGPFDKYNSNESKVIAALIRRVAENQNPLNVWGDGEDIKDFLFIDDFIDGLLQAFVNENTYDPINIASGVPVTIKEVIHTLVEISGERNIEILFDIKKPTMIPKRMISIDMAIEKLAWKPSVKLKDGLKETLEWYKNYFKNKTPEDV
jgi:GDP-L-fucose synthase